MIKCHFHFIPQDDSLDHSLGTMSLSLSMSGTNLYEAARLSGGSSIIENLQSQLKLREGEIAQLQVAYQTQIKHDSFIESSIRPQLFFYLQHVLKNIFVASCLSLRLLTLRGVVR